MNDKSKYDHKALEEKWREVWQQNGLYEPAISEPQSAENKFYKQSLQNKFYNLMMFPYPSAEGLHVGNMYAFTGADIYGRYQRMLGKDVFEPIGLDGFGIHSENYAIKVGRHPKEHAKVSEENFYRQLSSIGNGFSWGNKLETYDPNFYKWTQWLFVQMFKKGLAYREAATVNWCPSCKTVLADEQVEDEHCERCGHEVERKEMTSWYFKITEYADRLLSNIEKIDWPEKIKIAQRQWIGKKEGINITYEIKDTDENITCFTTRPDTNFGATFVVVAPEYAEEHLLGLISDKDKQKVSKYIKQALSKNEQQRKEEGRKKTGVFTGLYAINQLNGTEMPIWVSDFVLMGFGTGAVVGVPGHDRRDFEFAKEFNLPVARVVVAGDGDRGDIASVEQVQEDEGKMVNSDFLDGMDIHEAKKKIMDYIVSEGWGEKTTSYHLRDWIISRQRYWGPPIPMLYCDKCGEEGNGAHKDMAGWYPEEKLPVELPDIEDFKPKGDGTSPLYNAPDEWKFTECPGCGGKAVRELDVSDTFLDSSWYFLAYPNLKTEEWKGDESPFNKKITEKWLPVDAYIGGAEHAVLHLLYARFVTMALKDMGYLSFEEPFPYLFGHGLIIKDGAKMSKSKGNVIVPDEYIEKYGADALRAYLMFLGPLENGGDFRDTGMEGMYRFVRRVWELMNNSDDVKLSKEQEKALDIKLHQTIAKNTSEMSKFRFNTSISSVMELVNVMKDIMSNQNGDIESEVWRQSCEAVVLLLAPFTPFLSEEVWREVFKKNTSIHKSTWPQYDESRLISDQIEIPVQINGKFRATVTLKAKQISEGDVVSVAKENDVVKRWLQDKEVKKVIYVEGKMLNLIV